MPLSADDVKTLEGMVAQVETSGRAKPSVGQLVSVIVRAHLQSLQTACKRASGAAANQSEPDQSGSLATLQQLVEEQIRPLREQVRRLEVELQAVAGRRE